jgi:hypothetical protein
LAGVIFSSEAISTACAEAEADAEAAAAADAAAAAAEAWAGVCGDALLHAAASSPIAIAAAMLATLRGDLRSMPRTVILPERRDPAELSRYEYYVGSRSLDAGNVR